MVEENNIPILRLTCFSVILGISGIPSVGVGTFYDGDWDMECCDDEGQLHGNLPIRNVDGSRDVCVYHHGELITISAGSFFFFLFFMK